MQCIRKYLLGYMEHTSLSFNPSKKISILPQSMHSFAVLLQFCTDTRFVLFGKAIHAHMVRNHLKQNIFLQNNLLNLYCKCGSLNHAQNLFDAMPNRDIVSWNALVSGYFQSGFHKKAIHTFKNARNSQIKLDRFAYAGLLNICSHTGNFKFGKAVHGLVLVCGFSNHVFLTNSLMDMYSKCGRIGEVRRVFDNSGNLDDVSWNSLLSAHARNGLAFEAVKVFASMHLMGWKMNLFAVGSLFKCCSYSNEFLHFGRTVHGFVIKVGLNYDVFVGSVIIDMYAKNDELGEAIKAFKAIPNPNVVVFNAMIAGFCRSDMESYKELAGESFPLYFQMLRTGITPSKFTFSSMLKVCNITDSFELGKQIHAQVYKQNLHYDEFIGSGLIDLYSNSGSINDGLSCFHSIPKHDIVIWTSMISGYVRNECFENALSLFYKLLTTGKKPDVFTLSSVMSACANLATLKPGEQIQSYVTKVGLNRYTICGNAQIFMYARSGDTEAASQTFNEMDNRDVVSWSTMISNYAQHGCAKDALALFSEMESYNVAPNHITLLGVLTACSHGGLVVEGFQYFESMKRDYGVEPTVKHCACIVDLFGRFGQLDKAENFILDSGFQDDPVLWRALLSSCRIHCETERGAHVAKRLMELEPNASANYVILYNMYLDSDKRSMAIRIRELMKERGVKKEPGLSWIEVGGSIHSFVAGDQTHPQSQAIYARLEVIIIRIKKLDYASSSGLKSDNPNYEQKVNLLNCHSEKLAVTFGILSFPQAAPIRVMKNLRVCVDCHTTMKLVSKVEGREIVLRDPIRFHRFRDGSCSCGDYW